MASVDTEAGAWDFHYTSVGFYHLGKNYDFCTSGSTGRSIQRSSMPCIVRSQKVNLEIFYEPSDY